MKTKQPKPTASELAHTACAQLRAAYAFGQRNGGSMDWSHVDAAWETAKAAQKQAKREAKTGKPIDSAALLASHAELFKLVQQQLHNEPDPVADFKWGSSATNALHQARTVNPQL